MPASQAAASHTSRRFRGAARSGTGGARGFVPERAELLGAAAGAGAAVGLGRLADAFRRCRFEDPSLFIPAALGAAVGALAHLLLAERALGRAEAEPRRTDAEKAFLADAKKADDDPERALAGAGPTSGAEASEASDGSLWAFNKYTRCWCGRVCGRARARARRWPRAAAAHGGHAALPAAASVPKGVRRGLERAGGGGTAGLPRARRRRRCSRSPSRCSSPGASGSARTAGRARGAPAPTPSFQAATAAAMLAASARTAAPAARAAQPRAGADGGAAFAPRSRGSHSPRSGGCAGKHPTAIARGENVRER